MIKIFVIMTIVALNAWSQVQMHKRLARMEAVLSKLDPKLPDIETDLPEKEEIEPDEDA